MSLLSVRQLDRETVDELLERAAVLAGASAPRRKRGTVVNLFYEPSTRTSLSFQIAAQRLGMHVLDFGVDRSSIQKGESLLDTLQTLESLGVDIVVIRHSDDWPSLLSGHRFKMSLVNAGSGIYEHPTQALVDALTIKEYFGTLRGLTVTIVGDIRHSRVARSNAHLLQMMGSRVQFAGPPQFRADDIPGCTWVDFDEALPESDVLMMLRVQLERHEGKHEMEHYHREFGLNKERLAVLNRQALILHPGPVNRNVEIADVVLQDRRCRILRQVQLGVAVRMAVLEWCFGNNRFGQAVSA